MGLLSPPKSTYSGAFDQGRFNFMWRVFTALIFLFAGLFLFHLTQGDLENMLVTGSAIVLLTFCLVISKVTGRYTFGAIVGGTAASVINLLDLYLVVSSQKYVTVLWLVCISIYMFYLLGNRWGIATLVLNLIGVTISVVVIPKEVMIQTIESRDDAQLISIILNLSVITFFLAYLMHQILRTSRLAEEKSKIAQVELRKQYVIVQSKNEEKTVMLKEIHHRVKNNLQVITSLLRLQSKEIEDPVSVEHFNDAIQRVVAMALIHDKMYQSQDLAKIDLEAYLKTLAKELIDSYSVNVPIDFSVKCEMEFIQPKSLVSFALIFNELISNTLKHAFTNMDRGEIKVIITEPEKGMLDFIYYDSGEWKPAKKQSSFGVELIADLCEQLDGEYERTTENGTTYHFKFAYQNLE